MILVQSQIHEPFSHCAGMFSCCSIRLEMIVEYYNKHQYTLPSEMYSLEQFSLYNPSTFENITRLYFSSENQVKLLVDLPSTNVDYHHEYQFEIYKDLNYDTLVPIVQKYFYPSLDILHLTNEFAKIYEIDYDNTCVLFYRGNDKIKETTLCAYEELTEKAKLVLEKNPSMKLLVQSDETEFIKHCLSCFPNRAFYMENHIKHVHKNGEIPPTHYFSNYNELLLYNQYFLAIIITMSKCNTIICTSGNCSVWIMYYRGHAHNVYQNLNNQWYTSVDPA